MKRKIFIVIFCVILKLIFNAVIAKYACVSIRDVLENVWLFSYVDIHSSLIITYYILIYPNIQAGIYFCYSSLEDWNFSFIFLSLFLFI